MGLAMVASPTVSLIEYFPDTPEKSLDLALKIDFKVSKLDVITGIF